MAFPDAKNRPARLIDADTKLHNTATAITASAAGAVDGSAQVLTIGTGLFKGEAVIDVSAIKISANDEKYMFFIEGAQEVAMDTTLVPLATLEVGALEVLGPGSSHFLVDSTAGRYLIAFQSERDLIFYNYIRLYVVISGTSPSITFSAYLSQALGMAGT